MVPIHVRQLKQPTILDSSTGVEYISRGELHRCFLGAKMQNAAASSYILLKMRLQQLLRSCCGRGRAKEWTVAQPV